MQFDSGDSAESWPLEKLRSALQDARKHGHSGGRVVDPDGGAEWDLEGAMADKTVGAYFEVIEPVVEAVTISYESSVGVSLSHSASESETLLEDQTRLSRSIKTHYTSSKWGRMSEKEAELDTVGMHAFVFENAEDKRLIVAFRPGCHNSSVQQCRADLCVMDHYQTHGALFQQTHGVSRESLSCGEFQNGELDYVEQALEFTNKLQWEHPHHKVLLTGHKLGGLVATVTAAQDSRWKALAFAPSAYYNVLRSQLRYSESRISALASGGRLYTACDPYDCAITATEVPQARLGAVTCIYNQEPDKETEECKHAAPMLEDRDISHEEVAPVMRCMKSIDYWGRYMSALTRHANDGKSPITLPQCNAAFSTSATRELFKSLHGSAEANLR